MEYKFIANSGIQLFAVHFRIDVNSERDLICYDWFDEAEVQMKTEIAMQLPTSQKVVRTSVLRAFHYIDATNRLLVPEQTILQNPDVEILHEGDLSTAEGLLAMRLNEGGKRWGELKNKWLPLPYFEVDRLGNLKRGPFNWVRGKIVGMGNVDEDGLAPMTMLIAVDTRCTYDDADLFEECPCFENAGETEKFFKISDDAVTTLDFCSSAESWVSGFLKDAGVDMPDYMLFSTTFGLPDLMPQITIAREREQAAREVMMTLDLTSSRASAILSESTDIDQADFLDIQNFNAPLTAILSKSGTPAAFGMQMLFRQEEFGGLSNPGSAQFIWPSLVRLNYEATSTANAARYNFDLFSTAANEDEKHAFTPSGKDAGAPRINSISHYLNDDGTINRDGNGCGTHYSGRALLTFALMEIILHAKVQINSIEYREKHGSQNTPRQLTKILLTSHTAANNATRSIMQQCLTDAIWLLNKHAKYLDPTDTPVPVQIITEDAASGWNYDEATCAQIAWLHSKLSKTYAGRLQDLFSIYGKEGKTLRLASLDFGADVSDFIINGYRMDESNGAQLAPQPLFWDSYDIGAQMFSTEIKGGTFSDKDNGNAMTGCQSDAFFENIATALHEQDCDVLLLSGLMSADKTIRNTLLKHCSLSPNRIIHPGNTLGAISLGALAANRALTSPDKLPHLALDLSALGKTLQSTANYIYLPGKNGTLSPILTPTLHRNTIQVTEIPLTLGCRQIDSACYPLRRLFRLDLNRAAIVKEMQAQSGKNLSATEQRYVVEKYMSGVREKMPLTIEIARNNFWDNREEIEITEVKNSAGEKLPVKNFTLAIETNI